MAGELAAGIARTVSLLPRDARRDLRQLLSHELAAPSAELERAARLELLCCMIAEGQGEIPTVEDYEIARSRRGAPFPAASTLSRRYGGWVGAVGAASWLAAGGSGPPAAAEVRDHQRPYSRTETLRAVELCRQAVGEWPTASEYQEWRRLGLRLRRRFGDGRSRIPTVSVSARLFGGFERAVAAARRAEHRAKRGTDR